jgi:hypothetical protein
VSVNETLVKDKMRRSKGECAQFSFNKCLIYTHEGTSAQFSTNSNEIDNNAVFVEIGKIAMRVMHPVRIIKGRFYEKEERIIKCNGPLMYFEI